MSAPIDDAGGAIDGRVVPVTPIVPSTIAGPFGVTNTEMVGIAIVNDDGAQTLAAYVELAPTASGPWFQSPWTAFEALAAGASVSDAANTHGHAWMRIRGTASGAGLDCRVWVRRGRVFR